MARLKGNDKKNHGHEGRHLLGFNGLSWVGKGTKIIVFTGNLEEQIPNYEGCYIKDFEAYSL